MQNDPSLLNPNQNAVGPPPIPPTPVPSATSAQSYPFQQPQQPLPPSQPGSVPSYPPQSALAQSAPSRSNSNKSLVKIILIIALSIVSIIAITFVILYILKSKEYQDYLDDPESPTNVAVAEAVDEVTARLNADFAEQEKSPYATFVGPVDYGALTFQYPKTWSVYEAKDAVKGGDYEAYLNPGVVPPVSKEAIFALRVSITSDALEDVTDKYEKVPYTAAQINGENFNIYTGELPNKIRGKVAIFRIRDKTVSIQTDAETFFADFDTLLNTIIFNK